MSLAYPAFAEGSRDLIETPYGTHENMAAYRPYLEWRDREQLGGIPSKNVIYVYAQEGETVYFGSSVKSANDKSIKAVVGDNASQTISSNLQGSTIAVTLPTDEKEGVYAPTGDSVSVSYTHLAVNIRHISTLLIKLIYIFITAQKSCLLQI